VGKKKTNTKHELAVKKISEYVISSYFYYKVCEGCESVILEHRVFCPLCDSYNFDYSFKRINERVVELASVNHEAFIEFIDYFDK
jgi:rRNA maturation endonuclease Nob1